MMTSSMSVRALITSLMGVLCAGTVSALPVDTAASTSHSGARTAGVARGHATVGRMLARNMDQPLIESFTNSTSSEMEYFLANQISPEEQRRLQKQFDDYNTKHNLKIHSGMPSPCRNVYCPRDSASAGGTDFWGAGY